MKLDYTPFVVFGASKSGTTWLQKSLDAHPDVCCHFQQPVTQFPEGVNHLYHPAISVFNAKRTPFEGLMNTAEEKVYRNDLALLKGIFKQLTAAFHTSESGARAAVKDRYRKFIDAVLREPGYKACGTKSHSDLDLFLEMVPEGKIVLIYRDPRDVTVSKRFHTLRMGVYFLGDEKHVFLKLLNSIPIFRRFIKKYNDRFGIVKEGYFDVLDKDGRLHICNEALVKYVSEWQLISTYLIAIETKYPEQVISVRYEDLKNELSKELRKVLNFLGVDADEAFLEKVAIKKVKKKDDKNFFRKGIVGDWKNHLTEKQLATIRSIAGETAKKLGYTL